MKEELTQVSIEALKGLMNNLTQAKGFVLEQAPDVLQGLILTARIESSFCVAIAGALIVLGLVCLFWGVKENEEAGGFIGVLLFAIALLPIGLGFHDFITSWFAPKVYLVEHIAHMLKG